MYLRETRVLESCGVVVSMAPVNLRIAILTPSRGLDKKRICSPPMALMILSTDSAVVHDAWVALRVHQSSAAL
jgi:hypothetical protein